MPLRIELTLPQWTSVILHYRDINQENHYRALEMRQEGHIFCAEIPDKDLNVQFPLQYYFEAHRDPKVTVLYPGLAASSDHFIQPFFVVHPGKVA
jgi:hypothetical protein